jgi:uncharacterized protein (DUF433 family)
MKLGVYSADQVCRLAKISDTQLRYWYDTRVFRPQPISGAYGAFRRAYSFRDVVGLRTISLLRNTHRVHLDDLREVEKRLKDTPDRDWSNVVFYVGEDRRIYFTDPTTGATVSINPLGQASLFRMRTVIKSVERQLVLMNRRTRNQIGKIDRSRYVLRNASVVAGTRIPTSSIYDLYQAGFNITRIVNEYPRLTPQDVRSAIQFEQLQVASR